MVCPRCLIRVALTCRLFWQILKPFVEGYRKAISDEHCCTFLRCSLEELCAFKGFVPQAFHRSLDNNELFYSCYSKYSTDSHKFINIDGPSVYYEKAWHSRQIKYLNMVSGVKYYTTFADSHTSKILEERIKAKGEWIKDNADLTYYKDAFLNWYHPNYKDFGYIKLHLEAEKFYKVLNNTRGSVHDAFKFILRHEAPERFITLEKYSTNQRQYRKATFVDITMRKEQIYTRMRTGEKVHANPKNIYSSKFERDKDMDPLITHHPGRSYILQLHEWKDVPLCLLKPLCHIPPLEAERFFKLSYVNTTISGKVFIQRYNAPSLRLETIPLMKGRKKQKHKQKIQVLNNRVQRLEDDIEQLKSLMSPARRMKRAVDKLAKSLKTYIPSVPESP